MFDRIKELGFWYWLGRGSLKAALLTFCGLKIISKENIPKSGGAIIASNHISHLDPPAVGTSCPRKVRFVAKDELFHQPFLSWYLPAVGVIPIKRGSGGNLMLDKASEAIANGDIVVLFPEGTRSKTGLPGRAHTGIVVLAARTKVKIIPARVSGTYDCMPPGRIMPVPGKVQVVFGEPITIDPNIDLGNREQTQREAQRILDICMSLPGWTPKHAKLPPTDQAAKEGKS
jgi:1-acyl-sn-glycerol-3-phosphate acyltransferase